MNVKLIILVASMLLIGVVTGANAAQPNTPPPTDMNDYSCLRAQIASYRTAAAATVQSQADLALSQAEAYKALYSLQQGGC